MSRRSWGRQGSQPSSWDLLDDEPEPSVLEPLRGLEQQARERDGEEDEHSYRLGARVYGGLPKHEREKYPVADRHESPSDPDAARGGDEQADAEYEPRAGQIDRKRGLAGSSSFTTRHRRRRR